MAHKSIFTLLDRSGEKSSVTVHNGAITAVSIAGFLTNFGALRTAIEGITMGSMHKEQWIGDDTVLEQDRPTSNWAQRENKILVTYQGDTSLKLFTIEIPTANLDVLTLSEDSDAIVLVDGDGETPGPMEAFVTAFETIARSPDSDEETVTVLRARYVGRNI